MIRIFIFSFQQSAISYQPERKTIKDFAVYVLALGIVFCPLQFLFLLKADR